MEENMPGNNGNGTGIDIKGAEIDPFALRREDGIMTRMTPQTQSLLKAAISAIKDNNDYRQELKVARFASSDEADLAVSALAECFALDMDPTPIIDQIIARSAGKNHELLYEVFRTLTHTTFTTNYQGRKNNERAGSRSPFS